MRNRSAGLVATFKQTAITNETGQTIAGEFVFPSYVPTDGVVEAEVWFARFCP